MSSELAKALRAFQAELPRIAERGKAKIEGREGKRGYEHDFAPLEDVSDEVLPLLAKHGLAFTAKTKFDKHGKFILRYKLLHGESGEKDSGTWPLPATGTPQTLGAWITYGRRYCLEAITGVAPGGQDDDARGAPEVHVDRGRTTQRPPSDVPSKPVVYGKRTGPSHEQLRAGTVVGTPDDRPAERTRGPLPDNQWQDVPPEERPGAAKGTQEVQGIQIAYGKLGFDTSADREQTLRISEKIIRRSLEHGPGRRSHNNLSLVEAQKLKDTLESFGGDRGKLMERMHGITQAVAAVAAQDAAEATQEGGGDD